MPRIRTLTGPIALGALLVTAPPALGQDEEESPVEITCRACAGTEISSDQLGEFLAKNLRVAFTDMRPHSVALRLEMVSREEGGLGKYESEAVEVEGGQTYPASTWISQRDRHEALGFRDGRIALVGWGTWSDIREAWRSRECGRATHAVQITLVGDRRLFWEPNKPIDFVCLRAEG
jgi:hypothetical protein